MTLLVIVHCSIFVKKTHETGNYNQMANILESVDAMDESDIQL
jgi:hypothetical protein